MKTAYLTAALLLILGAGAACGTNDAGGGGTEIRQLGAFTSVNNETDAGLELVEPEEGLGSGDIMVICEDGAMGDVKASVEADGTLLIEPASHVTTVSSCRVRVVSDGVVVITNGGDGDIDADQPLQGFERIEVNGNGSVHVAVLEASVLELHVRGNGALVIDSLAVETLQVDLRGTGDITLGGGAAEAGLDISGNGNLLARELTVSNTLDAVLHGNGSAVITVTGTVNAEVLGNGSLEIHGDAVHGVIVDSGEGEVTFL